MNEFLFRSAAWNDLDELVHLELSVEQALPHRDMFAIDNRSFYEPIVQGSGNILLAIDTSGSIAGASVIRYPSSDDPENLGRNIALPEEMLSCVRHLESVFIHPEHQGKRLAEQLIQRNMELTEAAGKLFSLATVWPGNIASLKLHLRLGLSVRSYALKYGGKPRFILVDGPFTQRSERKIFIPATDLQMQRKLLAAGMSGTAIHG
ncbi:MAG: GNAT family N-acetyltransferase, partial [Mailhella sp.]